MTATVVRRDEKDITKLAFAINELAQGRSNATSVCTLRASQTTTVVSAQNCGANSNVFLSPLTANAAGALATSYISAVTVGSFTITHASNSQTDRTFGFVALG